MKLASASGMQMERVNPFIAIVFCVLIACGAGSAADTNSFQTAVREGDVALAGKLLLSNPTLANSRDELGSAALHQAAFSGDERMVKLLLAYHADVGARDSHGVTPLSLAKAGEHTSVVEVLERSGAGGGNTAAAAIRKSVADHEGRISKRSAARRGRDATSGDADPDRPKVTILLDPRMQRFAKHLESATVGGIEYRTPAGSRPVGSQLVVGTGTSAVPNGRSARFIVQIGMFEQPQFKTSYHERTERGTTTSTRPLSPGMPGHREVYFTIPVRLYYRDLRAVGDSLLFETALRASSDFPERSDGTGRIKKRTPADSLARTAPNPSQSDEDLVDTAVQRALVPFAINPGRLQKSVVDARQLQSLHPVPKQATNPNLPVDDRQEIPVLNGEKGPAAKLQLWNRLPVEVCCKDPQLWGASAREVSTQVKYDLTFSKRESVYLRPGDRKELSFDLLDIPIGRNANSSLRAEQDYVKPFFRDEWGREHSGFPTALTVHVQLVLIQPDDAESKK